LIVAYFGTIGAILIGTIQISSLSNQQLLSKDRFFTFCISWEERVLMLDLGRAYFSPQCFFFSFAYN